jgi:hypothetical protein
VVDVDVKVEKALSVTTVVEYTICTELAVVSVVVVLAEQLGSS